MLNACIDSICDSRIGEIPHSLAGAKCLGNIRFMPIDAGDMIQPELMDLTVIVTENGIFDFFDDSQVFDDAGYQFRPFVVCIGNGY